MMTLKRGSLSVAALVLLMGAIPAAAQQQAGTRFSDAGADLIDNDNLAKNRSSIVEDSTKDSFNTDRSFNTEKSFNTDESFNTDDAFNTEKSFNTSESFNTVVQIREDSGVHAYDSNSTYRNADVSHDSIFAAPVANSELNGTVYYNSAYVAQDVHHAKVRQDNRIDISGSLSMTGINTFNANTGANSLQQTSVSTSVVAIGY